MTFIGDGKRHQDEAELTKLIPPRALLELPRCRKWAEARFKLFDFFFPKSFWNKKFTVFPFVDEPLSNTTPIWLKAHR